MHTPKYLSPSILKEIITSSQNALIVLNKRFNIIYGNEKFYTTFSNIVPNTQSKKFFTELISSSSPVHYSHIIPSDEFDKLLQGLAHSTQQIVKKILIIDEKTFEVTIRKIHSTLKKQLYVISFYDISPIVNIQQAQKEFVSNASHELKTPLTSMNGYIELIMQENDIEKIHEYTTILLRNSNRIIRITDSLLSLASTEQNTTQQYFAIERCNINTMLQEVIDTFSLELLNKNLTVQIQEDKKEIYVSAYKTKLEEVWINLIDNAIKYTEVGSINIHIYTEDKDIVVEIKDTGIGIPQEYLDRVFERFFVVDPTRSKHYGGTGLGLAIVLQIIQLHNGSIAVHSDSTGTLFSVRLPHTPLLGTYTLE